MPKSWSKTKKLVMDGKAHQQRPDVDNLAKAICDAVFKEDSHIWDGRYTKVWGEKGAIIVRPLEIMCGEKWLREGAP
jgi:Holliday junction resolvase RusA-like endonuclease